MVLGYNSLFARRRQLVGAGEAGYARNIYNKCLLRVAHFLNILPNALKH
jgi:hypothetical protein